MNDLGNLNLDMNRKIQATVSSCFDFPIHGLMIYVAQKHFIYTHLLKELAG